MGGSGSKPATVGPEESAMSKKAKADAMKDTLQECADSKLIFDAHCHFSGYMQDTEGFEVLTKAMAKNKIGFAACTGCPFKKTWVGDPDGKKPTHHLYDDGDLYYFSACDCMLARHLMTADKKGLDTSKFLMMACGINLGDFSAGDLAQHLLNVYPEIKGFGEIVLQSDDINNMTIKGGNWTWTEPAVKKIIEVCAKQKPIIPFVFYSDARSVTTKPYRSDFEYLGEIEMVCKMNKKVPCLWCGAGVGVRGNWSGYLAKLVELVKKYDNLYISFTPDLVRGKYTGISREDALNLAEELPGNIVLGTTARGYFATANKDLKDFGEMSYEDQCKELTKFADQIELRAGPGPAAKLRYRTAAKIFNCPLPTDPKADEVKKAEEKHASLKKAIQKTMDSSEAAEKKRMNAFIASLAYGGVSSDAVCPPSISDKKWDTIDCHLHLLDFLQKSSGTTAALKAMDGCQVKKAVLFGMPCCKKWCFYRPACPLYYQDDNGPCYVYAYADQMVADAWLALEDGDRARFAPCFASFDPTDLSALDHVKRLYYKYPKMWRGIGEIMCRHDDLTTMLLGKEIPRVDHPALIGDDTIGCKGIFKFAEEIGLPCLVHHNSDRVGDKDNTWEYLYEVENVLKKYPKMKFVWVHAGVSRNCNEELHHKMISDMIQKYPNLHVDISWVVWEEVICDSKGVVKPGWVECCQKNHTKIYIGSDNVAQYFPILETETTSTGVNLLASNITKYYQLFEKLTPEAAENIAYNNAQKLYFDGWDVPSGAEPGTYARMPSYYDTECLDPKAGKFVKGATDLDDDGKY